PPVSSPRDLLLAGPRSPDSRWRAHRPLQVRSCRPVRPLRGCGWVATVGPTQIGRCRYRPLTEGARMRRLGRRMAILIAALALAAGGFAVAAAPEIGRAHV